MSDTSQGPEWWLGSDGKWYPPVAPASPMKPPAAGSPTASATSSLTPSPDGYTASRGAVPHEPLTPEISPPSDTSTEAQNATSGDAPPAPPTTTNKRVPLIVGGIVLAVAVLAGGFVVATRTGNNPIVPTTHTITGTMKLTDSDLGGSASGACYGTGGYSDIRSGGQVLVKDASNKLIAQGVLGSGSHPAGKYSNVVCELPFTVRDVPDTDFYLIEVSHRGEISHTKQELEATGWTIGFTLG